MILRVSAQKLLFWFNFKDKYEEHKNNLERISVNRKRKQNKYFIIILRCKAMEEKTL